MGYLKDFTICENDLLLNEKVGQTFGELGQIEVIGKLKSDHYLVKCSICSKDEELFGEGIFRITTHNLFIGKNIPCGCSKSVKWSEQQMLVRVLRKCRENEMEFLGWAEKYKGNSTKVKIKSEYGESDTLTISRILAGAKCKHHRLHQSNSSRRKPEESIIQTFFDTGCFVEGTKFWKSDRLIRGKYKDYWWVECPTCNSLNESYRGNLQKGKLPCECSNRRQKEAYINIIYDLDTPIALKFGIANSSKRRFSELKSACVFEIKPYGVWEFESKDNCKRAEFICKSSLPTAILTEAELKDGWSETTHISNLEKVIRVFEEYGGARKSPDQ